MSQHFTTFVVPKEIGLEHDTPFLMLGADVGDDIPALPLVTSLHCIDHDLGLLVHASIISTGLPVSDVWLDAVARYDNAAKVVIVREPMPQGADTSDVAVANGVAGALLPAWLPDLIEGRLHAAVREVPVTTGTDVTSIGMIAAFPTWDTWPDLVIDPANPPTRA